MAIEYTSYPNCFKRINNLPAIGLFNPLAIWEMMICLEIWEIVWLGSAIKTRSACARLGSSCQFLLKRWNGSLP
jgi:hypothetical protein